MQRLAITAIVLGALGAAAAAASARPATRNRARFEPNAERLPASTRDFPGLTSMNVKAPDFPKPGAKVSGTTWIDSPPLTMAQLHGKVVMIDFWEYTCINCIRTFAQSKEWWNRYHKDGFEIVGVHDPEFTFAYNVANVREAVERFGLPWPVVTDDWFSIWKSYNNNSWPSRYLIYANGYIRYNRIGEGADRAFEEAIRYLLAEAHPGLKFPASETLPPYEDVYAPGCGGVPTDEMYVGPTYNRGIVANRDPYHPGETANYKMPSHVADGRAGLSGKWLTDPSGMIYEGKSQKPGPKADRLRMRYHAAELYSVMHVPQGKPQRLYILQDGHWLTKANRGVDVKFDSEGRSYIDVTSGRMYYLVSNPSMSSHEVDLIPTEPGMMIDSFTFGNTCQRDFPHL